MTATAYLKMLRIGDWIKFYPFIPLIGALVARAPPAELILIVLLFCFVIAYGFVVNNYYDVAIDRTNEKKREHKKNPLVEGTVTEYGTRVLMLVLVIVPLAFTPFLNFIGFIFTASTLLALTFYSGAGLRLKDAPGIDVLTHGLMFGLLPFLAGFTLADGVIDAPTFVLAALFTILGFEALLTHLINDYDEDAGHTTTLATRIGQRESTYLLGAMTAAALFVLALFAIMTGVYAPAAVTAVFFTSYPTYMCHPKLRR
jgi:4-hydroxybenzoate polyprenyltransferase